MAVETTSTRLDGPTGACPQEADQATRAASRCVRSPQESSPSPERAGRDRRFQRATLRTTRLARPSQLSCRNSSAAGTAGGVCRSPMPARAPPATGTRACVGRDLHVTCTLPAKRASPSAASDWSEPSLPAFWRFEKAIATPGLPPASVAGNRHALQVVQEIVPRGAFSFARELAAVFGSTTCFSCSRSAWNLFEPRSSGVAGPSGTEAGRRTGQWRASAAACHPPATAAQAGLGAQGHRPGADRPARGDAGQGHPRGRRGSDGRAGSGVLDQDRADRQCLGLVATAGPRIARTVRAGVAQRTTPDRVGKPLSATRDELFPKLPVLIRVFFA